MTRFLFLFTKHLPFRFSMLQNLRSFSGVSVEDTILRDSVCELARIYEELKDDPQLQIKILNSLIRAGLWNEFSSLSIVDTRKIFRSLDQLLQNSNPCLTYEDQDSGVIQAAKFLGAPLCSRENEEVKSLAKPLVSVLAKSTSPSTERRFLLLWLKGFRNDVNHAFTDDAADESTRISRVIDKLLILPAKNGTIGLQLLQSLHLEIFASSKCSNVFPVQ